MKPLVSCIVPVYNVEEYLVECIESLKAQTYEKFEIILVNDGSTDSSGDICDYYARLSDNIKVIHTKNNGVSSARYSGVINSTGEYVTFVDSDDTLTTDAIEYMVEALNEGDIGIVYTYITERDRPQTGLYPIEQVRSDIIRGGYKFNTGPCAKLYKKTLLKKDVFDLPRHINKGEDMLMNIKILFETFNPIAYRSRKIYNYRIRQNSATASFRFDPEYELEFYNLEKACIPAAYHSIHMPDVLIASLNTLARNIARDVFTKQNITSEILHSKLYGTIISEIEKYQTHGYFVEKGIVMNLTNSKKYLFICLYALFNYPHRIITKLLRKFKFTISW